MQYTLPRGVSPTACNLLPIPRACLGVAGGQYQSMMLTTSVGICWQQGREKAARTWSWCYCVEPTYTGNEISSGVGSVVQWP